MQASASKQLHDDEHRVLSSSTNSSATDERLCEPIALPSGGALVRAAPNSEVFDRRSRPPSAPPAPDTTLLPSSSADLRVLRIPPGLDHPGGTMLQVTSRWSEIAPPGHADTATEAGTSVANPLADASSSGAVRHTAASPTVVGEASGAERRDAAPPSAAGGAVGAERPVLTLPSTLDAPSAALPSRDRASSSGAVRHATASPTSSHREVLSLVVHARRHDTRTCSTRQAVVTPTV